MQGRIIDDIRIDPFGDPAIPDRVGAGRNSRVVVREFCIDRKAFSDKVQFLV
jgi:hypothetical protein